MRNPAIVLAALALNGCTAAAIAVAPALPANPFMVPVSVTQAGSRIYDSLRACGQPGVDLIIGRADEITTSAFSGPFAGMRVHVEPAYPNAMVTVMNVPVTSALIARVQGWAVHGPDC